MTKLNNQNQEGPKRGDVFAQATVKVVLRNREDKAQVDSVIVSLQRATEQEEVSNHETNGPILADTGYTALVKLSEIGLNAEQLKVGVQLGSVVVTDSYPARGGKTQNPNGRNYIASRVLQQRAEQEAAQVSGLEAAISNKTILTVEILGATSRRLRNVSDELTCRISDECSALDGLQGYIREENVVDVPGRRWSGKSIADGLQDKVGTKTKVVILPGSKTTNLLFSEVEAYNYTANWLWNAILETSGIGPIKFKVDTITSASEQFNGDVFLSTALIGSGFKIYAHTTTAAWTDNQLPLPQPNDVVEANLERIFDHLFGYRMFRVRPVLG